MFPVVSRLTQLTAILPMSTAECKRGFSLSNRVKTKLRNKLDISTMDDLMFSCCNGPSLIDFDPTSAILIWEKARRHIRGHCGKIGSANYVRKKTESVKSDGEN